MDAEDRQLLTHLFAKATALLEDAIEPAVAGQSSRNTAKTFGRNAANLHETARNLAAIADSAEAILRMSETPPSKRKKAR